MTRTLVIVGCGAAKRDQEAEARDLYTSTYFKKKRAYAETIGDDYRILSAEHGLVAPDDVLAPYETHIDDLDGGELDALAHDVGMELINTCVFEEFDEVRVLAGRSYLDPLREREAFATAPATVRFPLQEAACGGIGEQMEWLDERVAGYGEQQRLVTDGGQCAGGTDRTQCTDKTCMGEAVYALWMGEQFSRVADAHPSYSYDDGDLHPHVCQDCLSRYRDLHGDKGEFVRPEEKLVTDGRGESAGVERYRYLRVHLCQSCGEGFEAGDKLVSLSDGFSDKNEDYAVENRRFWHRDCWRNSRYMDTGTDRSGGDSDV